MRTVCEIGFNAGHSAVMLLNSTSAQLHEFDLGALPYSKGSRSFVEAHYPGRAHFHLGYSQRTVAAFVRSVHAGDELPCDFWYVDGAHTGTVPYTDLLNALNASSPSAVIMADDCGMKI